MKKVRLISLLVAGGLITALIDAILGVKIEPFWIQVTHKIVYIGCGILVARL